MGHDQYPLPGPFARLPFFATLRADSAWRTNAMSVGRFALIAAFALVALAFDRARCGERGRGKAI